MAEGWTEDRIAQLRRLWGQGCSGSEIAAALGGVTRNGVIGKANRLRLTRDGTQPASPAPTAEPVPTPAPDRSASRGRARRRHARRVSQMRPAGWSPFPTCQFLHGEPRDRNFCGATVLTMKDGHRSSYCPEHHALCTETAHPARKVAA